MSDFDSGGMDPNWTPNFKQIDSDQLIAWRKRAEIAEARVAELEEVLIEIDELGPGEVEGCPKGVKFEHWDDGYCDGLTAAGIKARAILED